MEFECKHCGELKPKDSFLISKRTISGIILTCKDCFNKERAVKRLDPEVKNKDKKQKSETYLSHKIANDEWYKNYLGNKKIYRSKNRQKYLFLSCRKRAQLENLPFDLVESDIVIPEFCPILGIRLEFSEDNKNLNTPSVDKIIPELGYIKSNIMVISRKANMMKLNASIKELKLFAQNIINYVEKNNKNSCQEDNQEGIQKEIN